MTGSIKKFEKTLTSLEKGLEKPLQEVIQFIQDHKRILITLGIVYFIFQYFFTEEEEDDDEY